MTKLLKIDQEKIPYTMRPIHIVRCDKSRTEVYRSVKKTSD